MKTLLSLLALALTLLIPAAARAEQAQKFGDVEIHYNALPTTDLTPEIARGYKITRSKDRGLLTLSILKKNSMGANYPVTADVKVKAITIYSQLVNIDMREVKEGNAIYYLGEYWVKPPDTLKFTISVKPEGAAQPYSFDYTQSFY
ncbi:MAG: DUF4426 domain-containing protein [Sulfuricella sp.]|nr:DUF4426 domain-containing protein [Sulfuricella sp.]